jgi:uncharacterized protein (DUF4415 family)
MQKVKNESADEIRALRRMSESEIDTTDIPSRLDWSNGVVGKFYRPGKSSVTLHLDADVLAWLKEQGNGYQTRVNALLRDAMERSIAGKS